MIPCNIDYLLFDINEGVCLLMGDLGIAAVQLLLQQLHPP